jgi:hypothetical protein
MQRHTIKSKCEVQVMSEMRIGLISVLSGQSTVEEACYRAGGEQIACAQGEEATLLLLVLGRGSFSTLIAREICRSTSSRSACGTWATVQGVSNTSKAGSVAHVRNHALSVHRTMS